MKNKNDFKTVLISGATGMVGGFVLRGLLEDDSVRQIISIGRRKTGVTNKKLREIVHNNFLDFSGIKDELGKIDICYYCLGVYQPQVSKDKFFEITCDYQKALTDVLEKTSPQLTFVLFGARGADPSEKSRVTFAKAKGRAENSLNATGFPKKYIFRPGYIHPTGKKKPSGLTYKFLLPVGAALFKFFPSIGITDKDLAQAMIKVGLSPEGDSRTFENQEIKDLINK